MCTFVSLCSSLERLAGWSNAKDSNFASGFHGSRFSDYKASNQTYQTTTPNPCWNCAAAMASFVASTRQAQNHLPHFCTFLLPSCSVSSRFPLRIEMFGVLSWWCLSLQDYLVSRSWERHCSQWSGLLRMPHIWMAGTTKLIYTSLQVQSKDDKSLAIGRRWSKMIKHLATQRTPQLWTSGWPFEPGSSAWHRSWLGMSM